MRIIYSCIFYLITPLLLLKLWRRGRTAPAYRQRIGERFGFATKVHQQPALWVHAVSVGETVAIAPVLKQLLIDDPQLLIVLTTSTPTGADRVAQLFAEYPQLLHQYCPYDQPGAVQRFINSHRPLALLIVETELWPNMLHKCQKNNIPVLLANGRLSEKSAQGYLRLAALSKKMMQQLTGLVAQYASDGQRFIQLGLAPEKLVIGGSIKFDLQIAASTWPQVQAFRTLVGDRPVLILGSSHRSEEQAVLAKVQQLRLQFPNLLLIIVPRHPERFSEVAELAKQFASQVIRRTEHNVTSDCQVYIGDTMGELSMLYAAADLSIVGGSFVPLGGQNPLEPASVGKGVLMGPYQHNFSVICPELEAAGGMLSCADYEKLQICLQELLMEPERIVQLGKNAEDYFLSQRGASGILLQKIRQVLLKK